MTVDSLSLELSRKQKRLLHWRERFSEESLAKETSTEILTRLEIYKTLIGKLALGQEQEESKEQIDKIERELSDLFNSRRLATSEIGIAEATRTSERE